MPHQTGTLLGLMAPQLLAACRVQITQPCRIQPWANKMYYSYYFPLMLQAGQSLHFCLLSLLHKQKIFHPEPLQSLAKRVHSPSEFSCSSFWRKCLCSLVGQSVRNSSWALMLLPYLPYYHRQWKNVSLETTNRFKIRNRNDLSRD